MSGILAVLSLEGSAIPSDLARAQLAAIAHRGEWEPSLHEAPGIALGHVNLPRTPEAEREHLPAADPTGRYWLTWDGRLDNRDELAAALGFDAVERHEKTDADYVLAAYARWGDGCVHHLLGDWAIVIWDSLERRLFCAKDPLGWRPLFYAEAGGLLMVGSEPQQLFAGGLLPREPNHEYVLRYLADAVQEEGETCHAGVMELCGGSTLSVDPSGLHRNVYWDTPRKSRHRISRPEEAVEEFERLFRLATEARLRTNHKIALFLSGGLDSSYVAAIAAQLGKPPLAITGYAPGTELMDERHYARLVVDHLGLEQVEVDISACSTLSPEWLPDDVFDDIHHAPQYASQLAQACRARESGVGVTLGGDGADDWLTGIAPVGDALWSGRPRTSWRLYRARMGGSGTLRGYLKSVYRDSLSPAVRERLARREGRQLAHFVRLDPAWQLIRFASESPCRPVARHHRAAIQHHRNLVRRSVYWRERHAFTANAIDHRSPFQDLRVVELLASVPDWMKQVDGRKKSILRRAEVSVLPAAIPDRDDNGVFNELLFSGLKDQRQRVLHAVEHASALTGVDSATASDEARLILDGEHEWVAPTLRLISTGMWLHELGSCGDHPGAVGTFNREEVIAPWQRSNTPLRV